MKNREGLPFLDSVGDGPTCSKAKRYDSMLRQVREWEASGVAAEGRAGEVLRGTFAGARDPEVVMALKSCYCDYSALRLAGDLIYKLLKTTMKRRLKKGTEMK